MEVEAGTYHSFGEILRGYRKRKRITQKQLAQLLATHTNTISSWELGTYLPQTRGLVLEMARHLGLDDQETRQLLEASLTAIASYWHMPSLRNPFFTGREDILDKLHQCLSTYQASYVLHGLGGVGKTQIAVEYAYRHAQEYTAILWVDAETPESIVSSFLSISTLLGLPEYRASDQSYIASAVQRWLSTHRQWLLIWDNVEDFDLLSSYLPPARQGAMLFTTRRQTLGTLGQRMEVQPMGEEEGSWFLLRRAGLLDPTAPVEQLKQLAQRTSVEYDAAQGLVAAMDGLPLALDQVGAYVQETPCSLADYLKLYQVKGAELLKWRGEAVIDHPSSVVTTWSISFEKLEQANAAAVALLRLCAFLHPDAIPEELFVEGTALLGEQLGLVAADAFLWNEAIRAASAYSLLKRNTEEHTLSIHRLVQAVLRERMSEQERELWQLRAIRMLNAFFPEVTHDTQRQCERLLPHVLVCAAAIPIQAQGRRDLAEMLRKAADSLGEHGQYESSSPAALVRSTPSHSPALETAEPSVQSELPPSPVQPLSVSSKLVQGMPWQIGPIQYNVPPRPPKPPSHLPIVKNWSARKQVFWMVIYTLLELACWVPCLAIFLLTTSTSTTNSDAPVPFLILMIIVVCIAFFCLVLVPVSVLFAGAIFGGWRGGLVATVYTGIIAFVFLFGGKVANENTFVSLVVLFCSWPLAALVTGLLYQRRLFQGFRKAYVTMFPGVGVMVAALVIMIMIQSSPPDSLIIVVIYSIFSLICALVIACPLTLPIAVIEVIVQRNIAKVKRG